MISRRAFVSGLSGALATAGLSPTVVLAHAGGKPLRITHAVTSLAYIQSYIANQNGYFSQAGLTAQIIDTGGGGPDVQLVLGGRAEMTVNDGAQILPALQQGQKMICVLSLLNRSIVNATISKASAGKIGLTDTMPLAEKLSRLKGMKIGVTRPGALTWQLARFNLVSAGLNPDKDAQIVAVGGPPALAAALDNGAVDVIYISMPIGEKLIQEGKGISFINNAGGEDPHPGLSRRQPLHRGSGCDRLQEGVRLRSCIVARSCGGGTDARPGQPRRGSIAGLREAHSTRCIGNRKGDTWRVRDNAGASQDEWLSDQHLCHGRRL